MKRSRFRFSFLCVIAFTSLSLHADTLSFTGSLQSSTSTFQSEFTLSGASTVTIQTWGFGGGTNAGGLPIAGGGFDPLVAIFTGTGSAASIFNIGGDPTNPAGTSDTLSNYAGFIGCPPAGSQTIGTGSGSTICGDIRMAFSLTSGTYTLVLADANYQPNALIQPGSSTLGDGFQDFTNAAFSTCNTTTDGTFCVNRTSNWAVDISGSTVVTPVPEPATLTLLGAGVIAAWNLRRRF